MTDLADALLALLVLVAGTLAPIGLAALIANTSILEGDSRD